MTERKYITISESFELPKCKWVSISMDCFTFFLKKNKIIVYRYIWIKKKLLISVLI